MEAISIVALVLGVVAVVLLIVVLALTVRGGKKKNDSSVEIGQATVDVIKGEIARDGQTTRENVLSAMGLQNTSIQNALNANQTAISTPYERKKSAPKGCRRTFTKALRHSRRNSKTP